MTRLQVLTYTNDNCRVMILLVPNVCTHWRRICEDYLVASIDLR